MNGAALIEAPLASIKQECKSRRLALAIIIVFHFAVSLELLHGYKAEVEQTALLLSGQSSSTAYQMGAALRNVDGLLLDVLERLEKGPQFSPLDVQRLQGRIKASPEIADIIVVDKSGKIVEPTLTDRPSVGVDVSDREYFRYWRDHPADRALHISEAVISRVIERPLIPVSRLRLAPDGSFAGVVAAGLDVRFINEILEAANNQQTASGALLMKDGTFLTRVPLIEGILGKKAPNMVRGDKFSFTTEYSPLDGTKRFVGTRPVAQYPLFVTSTMSAREGLYSWTRGLIETLGISIPFSFAIYFMALTADRREHARRIIAEALREERDDLEIVVNKRTAELRGSEELFRSLFTGAKVAELIIDPVDGRIKDANVAASEYYGYGLEQLRSMHITDINILSKDEITREMELAKKESRNHFFFRHQIASGEVRDVEVHSGPLEIGGQKLLYSIIHDITDRKRLEGERYRLAMAIEQSPASILIADPSGTIEYVNPAFTSITGYSRDEAIGQNPRILKSGATSDEDYRSMWQTLTSGQSWRGMFQNKRKDGSLYWEQTQISPVSDERGNITHYVGVKENITDRLLADEAIRSLNRRLQDVLAAASEVAIIATDRDGTITLFNVGAEKMLGYSEQEVVGLHGPTLFHSHEEVEARSAELTAELDFPVEGFEVFVAKAQINGREQREWTYLRKDARRLTVELVVTPVHSEDGGISGYLGVATDITERKLAEMALIRERNFISSAIDSLPGIFYLINDKGGFDLWNRNLGEVTGYRTEEIAAMPAAALFDGNDRELIAAKIVQVFTEGQADVEASLVGKCGERMPYAFSGRRLASDDGVRLVGMGLDISERKRTEDLLREKEIILSESQRIGHVGTWHYVLGGKVTWSDETYRIFRVSPDSFIPSIEALVSLIHPDDRAAMQGWMEACAAGRQPAALEFRIDAADGTEWILSGYGELQRDAEDKPSHMVGIVHDISERKRAEAQLRQSNAELEQFAYVASHDLRQPLRMVSSYLGLIEKRLGPLLTTEIKEFLDFAVGGAKRMDRLILDLLEYSRTGRTTKSVPVPLEQVVADAQVNLTVAIRAADAEVAVVNGLPTVAGDPTELTRLFQNLIGNAVKYRALDRRPTVEIGCRRAGREWLISVKDNGIGIAAEDRERAFAIFQRLVPQDAYEGTGIGLAVCKKIVEHHDGRIWIESLPGEGSTFFFTLPYGST